MEIHDLQKFVENKSITGYRLKIEDPYQARQIALDIGNKFGSTYWARDWQEVNRNLFEAARLEKAVLFFVLLILVVAAAFNIANTLFVSVVQRFRDISVLKTLGASDRFVRHIFTAQGVMVGAMGAFSGILIGLILCRLVEWAQSRWQLVPAEVYKLDHIVLKVQISDLFIIVGVSLLICLIATLVPSRRGARISPIEGLRYE
jgi:lipoprotein-releasing system permease protein